MAAMKPRTGDGPLEVTKEGRGIVMRVPLEGGGRLVVELTPDEAGALGDALKTWSADQLVAATLQLTDQVPVGVAALAVPVSPGEGGAVLSRRDRADVEAFGADPVAVAAVLARDKVKGIAGDVVSVPAGERLLIVAGVGDGTPRDLRRAGAADRAPDQGGPDRQQHRRTPVQPCTVARACRGSAARRLQLQGDRGFEAGHPRVDHPGHRNRQARRCGRRASSGCHDGPGHPICRDLASMPSSTKTPAWLARQASTAARRAGLTASILDEAQLRAGGFGGVVGVGMGSVNPPRFIELSYLPAGTPVPGHVVLVGKGITFDSGGLSLKPNAGMIAMKTDMAAGGAVIATMTALRDLDVRVRVTGWCRPPRTCPRVQRNGPAT